MHGCWERSERRLEEEQCADGGSDAPSTSRCPHRAFWVALSALLLLIVAGLAVPLALSQHSPQPLQVVRITAPDQDGVPADQSAVVDQQNELVTFSVTSAVNRTSTVLYDVKHSLVCYKPADQRSCFLRQMEPDDHLNVQPLLQESTHKRHFQLSANETLRHTEFLEVLGARPANTSSPGEPLQSLCRGRSVHWAQKGDGPSKQRLVYFCIDICFPSNICVSVCFYYLPE